MRSSRRLRRSGLRKLIIELLSERIPLAVDIQMVKDINATPSPGIESYVYALQEAGSHIYFAANSFQLGSEPWKTDGTPEGTKLIKDINPGRGSSYSSWFTIVNNTVYFSADDGASGAELWKTDGTELGTVRVRDISPGSTGSRPRALVNLNGILYFIANDGSNGEELWKSDGTEAGTVLVKDIRQGITGSAVDYFINVNGTLFFRANDGTSGNELWKSDGTTQGTLRVKDIRPGIGNSSPYRITNINGTLYFYAYDDTNGGELWKSDGTESGTVLVKDIRPGASSSFPWYLKNVNGTLFFRANDGTTGYELWKSDGTASGTVRMADIRSGSSGSNPSNITDVGGIVYFRANDGVAGYEVWKSDGTSAGTTRVKDIRQGSVGSNPKSFTNINGSVLFTANDGSHGYELWRSDGTEAGTTLVRDLSPGLTSGASYLTLRNYKGTLLFQGNDGTIGYELWKSDGTANGTTLVKDVRPTTASSDFSNATMVDNTLFFTANDGIHGNELWKSDGTLSGTNMVKDIHPDPQVVNNIQNVTEINGKIYFTASNGQSRYDLPGLWKSDGSENGTFRIAEYASDIANVNGKLFYTASNQLWKSDGSPNGNVLVKDLWSTSSTEIGYNSLFSVGDTLYFQAKDSGSGFELWKSDGTEAGTIKVKDIRSGSESSFPTNLTQVNNTLYFTANDGIIGRELWKSDGTVQGTTRVKDIIPGPVSSVIGSLTNVNGTLFFTTNDGTNGYELWRSDGTETSTVLVKDIRPGSSSPGISRLTNANGTLYFTANDGTSGYELWRSDGTFAGTTRVKDIFPGVVSSYPSALSLHQGSLYFYAATGNAGRELWRTDGTENGTVAVDPLVSNVIGSYPAPVVSLGNKLLFTSSDDRGLELWRLIDDNPPIVVGLTSTSIRENLGQNAPVGTLSTTDPSGANSFTYSLVSGTGDTDNSLFNIAGGVLRASNSFDFETKASYSVRVKSTDSNGASFERIFPINVMDVYEPPRISGYVFEDFNNNASFDNFERVVSGAGFVYLDSNNNGSFDNGESQANYDSTGFYSFPVLPNGVYKVRTQLAGWTRTTSSEVYTVSLSSPSDFSSSNHFGFGKNNRFYGFVYHDTNADGVFNATESPLQNFNVITTSGRVSFSNNNQVPIPDLTTVTSTINVPSTGPRINDLDVLINIQHTWDGDLVLSLIAPDNSSIILSNRRGSSGDDFTNTIFDDSASVAIGSGAAPFTGRFKPEQPLSNFYGKTSPGTWSLKVSDQAGGDVGKILNWTLDFSNSKFTASDSNGWAITDLSDGSTTAQIESKLGWSFINPSSGNHAFNATGLPVFGKSFGVRNNTPTDIYLFWPTILENAGANALVGSFATTDPNPGDTFTYTLVSGTGSADNALFNISGSSLRANSSLDYESKPYREIRVRSMDQTGLFVEKALLVLVSNVNEAPTDISLSSNSIAENAGENATVGLLTTIDPDADNTFTYTLVPGTGDSDNSAFNISGNTLRATNSFDFETKSSYTVRVRSTDQGGLFSEKAFTINVTNVLDDLVVTVASGTGPGTLARMIQIANSQPGPDRIVFASSIVTVQPSADLPTISDSLVIDGENRVILDGTGSPSNGLSIAASNTSILNLTVTNYINGSGVVFTGTRNGKVQGSRIGTNQTGTTAAPNQQGILINNSSNILIGTDGNGTSDALERNVISGNSGFGLQITGSTASSNTVAGNYIGTNFDGTAAIANGDDGIRIQSGASNNTIGGSLASQRNIISGNNTPGWDMYGIHITANSSNNSIRGNYVGISASGTEPLSNNGGGIGIGVASNNNIVANNVISANKGAGVTIFEVSNTIVESNIIGLDPTGTIARGNSGNAGIVVAGSVNTRIGTNGDQNNDTAERNIISGNSQEGIQIEGSTTIGTIVAGNYIGTNSAGTAAIPNAYGGMLVWYGPQNTRIGTDGNGVGDIAERNLISGNIQEGIQIEASTNTVVAGNYIGTNFDGSGAIPNTYSGILLWNAPINARIGTDGSNDAFNANERNLISGNTSNGITVRQSSADTVVAGNWIGLNANGTGAIPNTGNGIEVSEYAIRTIIGTNGDGRGDADENNTISGNSRGILVSGSNATPTTIAGNYIGTNATGIAAIGNSQDGILIENTGSTRVGTNGDGTSDSLERNVISGNAWNGIQITGLSATNNIVAGNYIGTNSSGTAALANSSSGVRISGGASSNLIGTNGDGVTDDLEGNIISGNNYHGILVGTGSTNTVIAGNRIGTDVSGTLDLGNVGDGVRIENAVSTRVGTNGDGTSDLLERNIISCNDINGVDIRGAQSSNNLVMGNTIGLNASGIVALGNTFNGVSVSYSGPNNRVSRNLISSNGDIGVIAYNAPSTWVDGNTIGLAQDGTTARGNRGNAGVLVSNGATNTVIGTNGDGVNDELERNIISGNSQEGIQIEGSTTTGTIVAGNYIGTNTTGTSAIPNSFSGILVLGGPTNTRIGTDGNGAFDANERNVISGNSGFGVNIGDSGTKNSIVAGNYIGTNASGTAALPNSYGIYVTKATDIRIGTNGDGVADELERNVISGNTSDGVYFSTGNPQIYGLSIVDKILSGDVASTQSTGTITEADLSDSTSPSNGNWGYNSDIPGGGGDDYFVVVTGTIQVTTAGTYSFSMAGDNGGRLKIDNATIINDDSLHGFESRYGQATLSAGTHTFEWIGFEFYGAAGFELSVNSAANNTSAITSANGWKVLGDPSPHSQIRLSPGTSMSVTTYTPAGPEKSNSDIAGNYIGTNASGNSRVANGRHGIFVDQSRFVTVGGDSSVERNVVSGNGIVGILVRGSTDLTIEGNYVGLAANGVDPVGNSYYGLYVWNQSNRGLVKNNAISCNGWGIYVAETDDIKFVGNIIGLTTDGMSARSNLEKGLFAKNSKRLQVGTDGDGVNDQLEGNVISANYYANIRLDNTENSVIAGNIVGLSKQHSVVGSSQIITDGIIINSGKNVRIGTDGSNDAFNEFERNVVGGNSRFGIRTASNISTTDGYPENPATDVVIAGNWIGVDPRGNRRANQGVGVRIESRSQGVRIGTNSDGISDALEANTIAGNASYGIEIGTTTSLSITELTSGTVVAGNFIGVLSDGITPQPNDDSGIIIRSAPNTLIGSNGDGVRDSVERNIISGNKGSGIEIRGGVHQIYSIARAQSLVDGTLPSNRVSGKIAQTDLFDVTGGDSSSWNFNHPIPGGGGDDYAIRMTAEIEVLTAGDFTFATYSDEGSQLKVNGVLLASDETVGGQTMRGSINLPVGTYPVEWLAYERGFNAGFELSLIPGNNITSSITSANNWKVLGDANPHSQIRLKPGTSINVDTYYSSGRATTNATVRGNIIGTDANGQLSGLGNMLHGISLDSTKTVLVANNLVSGNVNHGIYASADSQTTLQGNFIGTNATGTSTLGNQLNGVTFVNGSSEIVLGGSSPQQGNLIAGNSTGVRLDVPATNVSVMQHNRFYQNTTLAIDVGPAGSTPNDDGDADGVRNAPVITAVQLTSNSLVIEGFARPGTAIDFYKTRSYASGFGQGETYLASVVEGGDKDQDSAIGSYNSSSVGGIAVGSDTTNRFRFVLPLSELQDSITGGERITAVAINPTSEFGNQAIVSREITLTSATLAENAGVNAVVGTLSTANPGAANTFTYNLVSGTGDADNAAFNIDGDKLQASSSFDFEAKSSYSVRIRSTDQGGLWTEKVFNISVTDVNESPTDISLSASSIAENAGANATVGTLITTDPDTANTFAYTLVSGTGDTDNAAFNIDGEKLRANRSFDFETKSNYSVRVRSTDQGGLWTEKVFTISLTDVNETPTNISLSANSIAENAGANAMVGTLSTTDSDSANTFTYTLVSGTGDSDNAVFNIDGDKLRTNSSFDFEAKSSYSVRVRSTDQGGLWVDKVFTISVTDVNEFDVSKPIDSNSAPNTLLSTATIGTPVGITALASDLDGSNNSVTYSLDDSENNRVAIDPVSGVVTLAASILNSSDEAINITVRATSSDGSSATETFSIQIQTVIDLVGTPNADQFIVNQLGANLWSVTLNGNPLFNGSIFTSGLLRIDGLQGSDTLAIYGTSGADSFRVREDRTNLNGLDIIQLQTEQRSVWGLGAGDNFQIENSIQGVYGGDGQDRIVLADATKTVSILDAGTGYDTLDYSPQAGPISYSIGSTSSLGVTQMISVDKIIGSQGSDSLVGQNVLTDWALTGPDQTQVNSIDYHSFENLVGGTAVDRFQLWSSTAKLSGIANGGIGSDRLTAFDQSNTWQLNGSKTGNILNTIAFADVEALVGGTGNDQYLVQPGAVFASVSGGTGQDELNYSSYGATVSVTMATSSITAAGLFSSIESIVGSSQTDAFTAGNGTNSWIVSGSAAGQVSGIQFASFELLRGGSGVDTFQIQAGSVPNIFGGAGIDTIVGPNTSNAWKISASAAGTLNTTTAFREFENVTGGNGNDVVELTASGALSGTLSGGSGTNTLSYQSFTSTRSAAVNVTANRATGIGNLSADFQIFIGGAGNDTLKAFPGVPTALIGNAGDDQLTGSSERDILIGGGGADTLNGGGGQDILIGASTSYDLNPQAVSAIRNEWLSTRNYAERIANIRGIAVNGTPLNNGFYLQPGPTGTLSGDSGQVDTLFGQSDTDWFIAESSDLSDRLSDEQLLDPLGN